MNELFGCKADAEGTFARGYSKLKILLFCFVYKGNYIDLSTFWKRFWVGVHFVWILLGSICNGKCSVDRVGGRRLVLRPACLPSTMLLYTPIGTIMIMIMTTASTVTIIEHAPNDWLAQTCHGWRFAEHWNEFQHKNMHSHTHQARPARWNKLCLVQAKTFCATRDDDDGDGGDERDLSLLVDH